MRLILITSLLFAALPAQARLERLQPTFELPAVPAPETDARCRAEARSIDTLLLRAQDTAQAHGPEAGMRIVKEGAAAQRQFGAVHQTPRLSGLRGDQADGHRQRPAGAGRLRAAAGALRPAGSAEVTAPPPAAPPTFATSIRLPPHGLEVDEAKFLRLLCSSFSLHIIEKRMLIRSVPDLRQDQIDGLLEIFEEDEAEQERRNALDPKRRQGYEEALGRLAEKWRWLEGKIAEWP